MHVSDAAGNVWQVSGSLSGRFNWTPSGGLNEGLTVGFSSLDLKYKTEEHNVGQALPAGRPRGRPAGAPPGRASRNMFTFCPNALCLIPEIQPIMLGLCPIMPEYADELPKDAQVECLPPGCCGARPAACLRRRRRRRQRRRRTAPRGRRGAPGTRG
jgi:hypothetical protein